MICLNWKRVEALFHSLRKPRPASENVCNLSRLKHIANINQVDLEAFTRTISILDPALAHRPNKFKAVLDTGCHAGNLITSEVVAALGCMDNVQPCNEVLGICLNGDVLKSTGTIELQWEGAGCYKILKSRFHVIEGNSLAWQIILGAETCASHSLLTVGAFGLSKHQVFPKKGKKHDPEDAARKDKHKQDVADNAERVARDKAEKKAAKDQQQRGNGEGSSRNRH
ncbi:hypothetical protein N431DRAFT_339003 [Stipitochalara longipes BDJ]|nr:hypothetical protein N431DRAFT_339003 [Stipitochalara longipes BDJ]